VGKTILALEVLVDEEFAMSVENVLGRGSDDRVNFVSYHGPQRQAAMRFTTAVEQLAWNALEQAKVNHGMSDLRIEVAGSCRSLLATNRGFGHVALTTREMGQLLSISDSRISTAFQKVKQGKSKNEGEELCEFESPWMFMSLCLTMAIKLDQMNFLDILPESRVKSLRARLHTARSKLIRSNQGDTYDGLSRTSSAAAAASTKPKSHPDYQQNVPIISLTSTNNPFYRGRQQAALAVIDSFIDKTGYCAPPMSYQDREMIADNIKDQIGAPTLTENEMLGLVGWNLAGARRMGIQKYWGEKACIKKRQAQCVLNGNEQDEVKKRKMCQYQKCARCHPENS